MKLLSISIAAYNIEEYIEQCLNSFADERFNETLEVLIVNDGSKDGTVKIAERYVQQYPDIFRLINKENGGHGSTINRGIKEAVGKYYKPVDGDDWLDTENLASIIDRLKEIDVDLVVTDFFYYYPKTKEKKKGSLNNFNNKNTVQQFDLSNDILLFHQIMYRTSILKKNNVLFSEKIFFEDTEFCLYPIEFVSTMIYIPIVLYYYRQDREGQSVSIEGIIKHKNDLRQVIINIFNFYKIKNNHKIKMKFYERRIKVALDFYYKSTTHDLWIKLEGKNVRENQFFYKQLLFISPYLFLSFMTKDKTRLLMLLTWFSCDKQILNFKKEYNASKIL